MNLKKMIAVCAALAVTVVTASARDKKQPTGMEDRQVWVNTLVKIADPVLSNLANNTLRENMPQESLDTKRVHRFSHLEAVGRTLCGIAPWLELVQTAETPGTLCGTAGTHDLTGRGVSGSGTLYHVPRGGFSCAGTRGTATRASEDGGSGSGALRTDGCHRPTVCRSTDVRREGMAAHRLCRKPDQHVGDVYQHGKRISLYVRLPGSGTAGNGSVLDGAFHSLDGPEGMERRGRDGGPCDR